MSIPTLEQARTCTTSVWQEEGYQRDILWAGIFGSVSRNRPHEQSDVDFLIVLKEHERHCEPLDLRENLLCIWQGPDWAWGHVRVEALLSSRTVYGNCGDVEHLCDDAMTFLDDGLNLIAEAVEKIKDGVATTKPYDNFIHPSQKLLRQECIQQLRKVVDLLDIKPLHHPMRTMIIAYAFEWADKIRVCLDEDWSDTTTGMAPDWRKIWDYLQPASTAMWAFDTGCDVGGRAYIRHVLASKMLADRFEEGGQIDDGMYNEIAR